MTHLSSIGAKGEATNQEELILGSSHSSLGFLPKKSFSKICERCNLNGENIYEHNFKKTYENMFFTSSSGF
jgi:hypothetical protein